MLILTRKVNESIVVGDPRNPDLRITVAFIHGKQVKLALEAPRNVRILREELCDVTGEPGSPGQYS